MSPSESIHGALSDALLISAVRNLLDNALAYSPADQTIDVTLTPSAASLEIPVRDCRPGLSSAQCERAVEPIWRGVRHTSGSGLGLSIVAAIAKQHGGLLQLLPAPDGGLACRLTLPLAAAGSS